MRRIRRWILIADGAGARIVERLGTGRNARIIEPYRFDSRASLRRQPPCERTVFIHDQFGIARCAITPECGRRCSRSTRFACQLADLLRERAANGDFDRLLIVAPEAMLEDLRAALTAAVRAVVTAEIAANEIAATNLEVVQRLETNNLLC